MSLILSTCVAVAVLFEQSSATQGRPDFSGRWVMVASKGVPRDAPALTVTIADELTIRQTETSVTVEHPSTASAVPKAATHGFGSHGTVSSVGGRFRSDVFWLGDQFVVSTTTTDAPALEGRARTLEHSEQWSLDAEGRLVIEYAERRSGVVAVSASLTYKRR